MKRTKKISAIAAICTLLLAVSMPAQDNEASADKKSPYSAITNTVATKSLAEDPNTVSSASPSDATEEDAPQGGVNGRRYRGPLVVFGRNAELKAGDSAEAVVVLWGNAKIHGKVRESVVTIRGSADIDGEVGQDVVSILGDIKVRQGAKLHAEAVAVGGDVFVDGSVRRDVVAVLGDVKAGQNAHLSEEVVAVGGKVDLAEGAVLDRQPVEFDFGGLSHGLRVWLAECLLKLRPLAPQVGWIWLVAGFFFVIYLGIALVFPKLVLACVGQITTRPAATFFMGLLAKILVPIVITVLALTGVGALVVPFVLTALVFGAFVGKVALFESIGMGLGHRLHLGGLQAPLTAFLAGIAIIVILYMVPVLGLITLGVVSVWGLGGAVTAAARRMRREVPEKASSTPTPFSAAAAPPTAAQNAAQMPASEAAFQAQPAQVPSAAPGPALIEAFSYPRASFWERLGAGFLDLILVSILAGIAHIPRFGFLIALAYFAALWTWKGTTIGGIVLGLKVVRLDGQPVNFVVALVRGLAAAFSIIVFFLGFLWMIWDAEKQAWHDKIAGTVVIRLPRGTPLVCI